MADTVFKNKIVTHNMLLYSRGILVTLVILFAILIANFWFTIAAYPFNIKSNSSGNLYSSNSTVGLLLLIRHLVYLPNSEYWNSFGLDRIDHTLL